MGPECYKKNSDSTDAANLIKVWMLRSCHVCPAGAGAEGTAAPAGNPEGDGAMRQAVGTKLTQMEKLQTRLKVGWP